MGKITISQAAKILGVSKKTMMRWDEKGKYPSERDPNNNFRYYDENEIREQVRWLKLRIKHRNHNRKLTAIRKTADKFSATIPLYGSYSQPKHSFADMKKAYKNLKNWEKGHEKILAEYVNFSKGFRPKIDVTDFEKAMESDDIAKFVKELVSIKKVKISVEGDKLLFNLNLKNNNKWHEVDIANLQLYKLEKISKQIQKKFWENTKFIDTE